MSVGKLLLYSALFIMAVLAVLSFGLNMLPEKPASHVIVAPSFIGKADDNATDSFRFSPTDKPKEPAMKQMDEDIITPEQMRRDALNQAIIEQRFRQLYPEYYRKHPQ